MTPLTTDRFQALSVEHYWLMVGFLVGCVAVSLLGRRLAGHDHELLVRRVFAIAIVSFTVPLQIEQLLPGDFGLGTSLPLQVCDLAWIVAAFALWTRSARGSALLYYWGLTLVTQAIVTPSLQQEFPDPRFFMFWGMHFCTVWAACFLTFGLGIHPSWRGYRFAVLVTFVWAVAAMGLNAVIGTNYGYLNGKPKVDSLLNLLGPWPVYVMLEMAVVVAVWALITWPWNRSAGRPSGGLTSGRGTSPSGGVPQTEERPAVGQLHLHRRDLGR